MDGNRFDELTRAFAGSRRGLLRGAVAATGAVLGGVGLRRAEAACIRFNRPCSGSQTCCNGAVCSGGRCRCGAGTQVCAAIPGVQQCVVPCPPGQSLSSNCRCLCNIDGRPPRNGSCGTLVNGEACETADVCQSNFCNTDEGVCSDPCSLIGGDCGADGECCSGACDEYSGACVPPCLDLGASCSDPDDCCDGGCNDFCCIPTGSACASDDCCGGSCYNGTCCNLSDDGFSCVDDGDCCSGICDAYTSQCIGSCLPTDTSCLESEDCCTTLCYFGTCCLGADDGDSCSLDNDCCSGICNNYTSSCITTCLADFQNCAESSDCCSGFCDFEFTSFGNCQPTS